MKKFILLLFMTVSTLGTAQKQNTAYIWIDLTDELILDSHKEKAKDAVNALYGGLGDRDNGLKIKVMAINHRLISDDIYVIDLPKGSSNGFCLNCQSVKERKAQVKKKKQEALDAIDKLNPIKIYQTRIYENLRREFKNLNKESGKKYAIVFSDLLENSHKISLYGNIPDASVVDFGVDLSDMEIYLIRDCRQDQDSNDLCDDAVNFWAEAFDLNGVVADINSTFIL